MVEIKNKTLSGKTAANIFIVITFFILTGINAYSQLLAGDAPPIRERLFFGGEFGLQFGYETNIEVAPVVGLWVLPRLAIAAGPEYTYYARRNIGSTSIYGGRFYTQFVVVQDLNNIIPAGIHMGLFIHAEDEFQSLESETPFWKNTAVNTERFNVNTFLVGGGISQQMGKRAALNFIFLWALDDEYDLYSNPEIRISFVF